VDTSRGPDPVSVFCGDTLFVGDVGRPDLFPDVSQKLASGLYDSLYLKLLRLPDFCEVYPGHGAGSLCGRSIGAKRSSTIGYEKGFNESLNLPSREEFIHTLTTNMPAAPDHFSRCSDINRIGPVLLKNLPQPVLLSPLEFKRIAEQGEYTILDVRSYEAFGSQFISNSYHNDIGGNFAVFAGWVLPPQQAILLIVNDISELERAVTGLRRVGIDNITGYLDGGLFGWSIEGLPAEHIPQLSAEEVHRMINTEQGVLLLDVRTPAEYERFHIEGAYHIPVPDLRQRYRELDTDSTIIVMCSTGRRSSMAASILNQHGFRNIFNAAGGMTGYHAAGYSQQCPVCSIPHGPRMID
jgi:rhodanese-related sulfurtransferase